MIADTQTQDVVLAAVEEQFAIVKDVELLYVGGGMAGGCLV